MIKLIMQVNPKAGCEKKVFDKINETFGKPFISQIEQLSDFYTVLDFTADNVEKVTAIQDFDGILDVTLTPTDITLSKKEKAAEGEDYYIVFVDVEKGRHIETMKKILACNSLKVRNAGYYFDNRADIIVEVLSKEGPCVVANMIRGIEGVEDTIVYTLPHKYE